MSKEEIAQKLSEFADYLNKADIWTDPFRWIGWVFVQGVSILIDGLEGITDDVLLIKTFFENPEVVSFVASIRPFLYILLAFNLLFVGYLLIFQKKFDREGIAVNLFIALAVVALLGSGMTRANEFTDEAIDAVKAGPIYESDKNATLADTIIKQNVTDLLMFDKNGWKTTDLDVPNEFKASQSRKIDIKQRFVKDDLKKLDIAISADSEEISRNYLLVGEGSAEKIAEFDQGGLMKWNNTGYYRYDVNWLTLLTTLVVIGFTLFSIAFKLARLAFEMTFNYVLATIVAPADIHDGQKTKKILQSILNTFIVIILIFISMKIYTMGTSYLSDRLDGIAYLIALIAFSVAVIDGPNMVERLFGIDAGLKSGWGVLAGAYAGAKFVSGFGRSMDSLKDGAKSLLGGADGNKNGNNGLGKVNGSKAPSPNGEATGFSTNMPMSGSDKAEGAMAGGLKAGSKDGEGVGKGSQTNKAPSPNDADRQTGMGAESIHQESGATLTSADTTGTNVAAGGQTGNPEQIRRNASSAGVRSVANAVDQGGAVSQPSAPSPNVVGESGGNTTSSETTIDDVQSAGQDAIRRKSSGTVSSVVDQGGAVGAGRPSIGPSKSDGSPSVAGESSNATTSSEVAAADVDTGGQAIIRRNTKTTGANVVQDAGQGSGTVSRPSGQSPKPSGKPSVTGSNEAHATNHEVTSTVTSRDNVTVRTDEQSVQDVRNVNGGRTQSGSPTSSSGGGSSQSQSSRTETSTSNRDVVHTERVQSRNNQMTSEQTNVRKRPAKYSTSKAETSMIEKIKNHKLK